MTSAPSPTRTESRTPRPPMQGVLSSASSWAPANAGLLFASARSFATLGGSLYVGTGGAPIYRLSGEHLGGRGHRARGRRSISDVATSGETTYASARGAGLAPLTSVGGNLESRPEGCGDVRALAPGPKAVVTSDATLVAATNCHFYYFDLGPGPTGSTLRRRGRASRRLHAHVARRGLPDGSIAGGTSNAGMWRFVSFNWSADNPGLPANGSVQTTRQVGGKLYASVGASLFVRQQSAWQAVPGAPSFVQALGGDANVLFAASVSGGISSSAARGARTTSARAPRSCRRSTRAAAWPSRERARPESSAGARAAGSPRTPGFPAGADVRVVRKSGDGSVLYAGTAGNGLWVAPAYASAKYVPVVLDLLGSRELALQVRPHARKPFERARDGQRRVRERARTSPSRRATARSPSRSRRSRSCARRTPSSSSGTAGLPITLSPSGTAGSIWVAVDARALPAAGTDSVYAFSRTYTAGAAGSLRHVPRRPVRSRSRRVRGNDLRPQERLRHVPVESRGRAHPGPRRAEPVALDPGVRPERRRRPAPRSRRR